MGWVLVVAAVILPVLEKRRRCFFKPKEKFEFGEKIYATNLGDCGSRLIGITNLQYHGVNHGHHITE